MARSGQVAVLARKMRTQISISVTPLEGDAPFDITVTGILTDQRNRVLGGKTVNLYINDAIAASTMTDAAGNYSFVYTIDDVGTWLVETEFPGDAQYLGCIETSEGGAPAAVATPNWLGIIAVAGAIAGILYLSRD